jgi:hypothetical protein
MYGGVDVRLASVWAVGLILFKFGIQEFIHSTSVPAESDQARSKKLVKWAPQHKMVTLIENSSNDFD